MFRAHKLMLAAIAGLALVSASPSKQGGAQAENPQAGKAITNKAATADPAIPEQPIAPRPDEGCKRGDDDRKSDLCAQWKAADAAYDSAWWTGATFYTALIGLLLGSATMAAAIAAAIYAKRAAEATEATVKIGEEASERQFRPWLTVKIDSPFRLHTVNGLPKFMGSVHIENVGHTPAVNISYVATMCVGYEPDIQMMIDFSARRKEYFGFIGDMFPGKFVTRAVRAEHSGRPVQMTTCYFVISVFYRSVFSETDKVTACFFRVYAPDNDDKMIDLSQSRNANQIVFEPWDEMPGVIE
jgi:hypothetical protein